jgi:Zn-dependent peptidase ImmA (M78 family)
MPNRKIEAAAEKVLNAYRLKSNAELTLPINVELIINELDDFYVDIMDLQSEYGQDAIGAIFFENGENCIAVDKTLDPDLYPHARGRYNFTVAHECGHWILHAPAMLEERRADKLFETNDEPLVLCRSHNGSSKPEIERQADRFASYVLMPREQVVKEWLRLHPGQLGAMNVHDELQGRRKELGLAEDEGPVFCDAAREMARVFDVSIWPMQIRLAELKLINTQADRQLELF